MPPVEWSRKKNSTLYWTTRRRVLSRRRSFVCCGGWWCGGVVLWGHGIFRGRARAQMESIGRLNQIIYTPAHRSIRSNHNRIQRHTCALNHTYPGLDRRVVACVVIAASRGPRMSARAPAMAHVSLHAPRHLDQQEEEEAAAEEQQLRQPRQRAGGGRHPFGCACVYRSDEVPGR